MDYNQKYPKISVDFRKLDRPALIRIMNYFKVRPAPEMTTLQLANAVARYFDDFTIPETETVEKFAAKYCYSTADKSTPRKRQRKNLSHHVAHPAALGEQVAAKISSPGDEEGSWILGNVMKCNNKTRTYEVQDEDDVRRIVTLPFNSVRRLEDSAADIRRGDRVLAVFPETTSFYDAVVVKTPKSPAGNNQWEVVVRFEDDEDETGKAPPRRVPARFVVRASAFEKSS